MRNFPLAKNLKIFKVCNWTSTPCFVNARRQQFVTSFEKFNGLFLLLPLSSCCFGRIRLRASLSLDERPGFSLVNTGKWGGGREKKRDMIETTTKRLILTKIKRLNTNRALS